MSAFTPGPWEVISNGMKEGWPAGMNPIIRHNWTSGQYVAEIRAHVTDAPDEVAANARLIAAAPALLEALAMSHLALHRCSWRDCTVEACQGRAAIAMAVLP